MSSSAVRRYASYDDWLGPVEIRTLAETWCLPGPLTERHALTTGYLLISGAGILPRNAGMNKTSR